MAPDESQQHRTGDKPAPAVSATPEQAQADLTLILSRIEQGDGHATKQFLPLVYDELRKLAAAKMAQERPGQTLQATALVHEAYIRLVDTEKVQHWNSRGHFFAAAAEAMRRILVERARQKGSAKRGGDWCRVGHDVEKLPDARRPDKFLALDEALTRLEQQDATKAQLVKLRSERNGPACYAYYSDTYSEASRTGERRARLALRT